MTFQEYINNPAGRNNAVYSYREMYRDKYRQKLDAILVREAGAIKYVLYKSKHDYYVHMKIPSETINKFYYDVVVRMYPKNAIDSISQNLADYEVQFYSNDPMFVFTFAHSFSKNGLFIDDLKPKMSKIALKNLAEERNPKDEIGYVKSIFFAYLYMQQRGLFSKIVYDVAYPYDKNGLLSDIMDADEKVKLRQEAKPEKEKKSEQQNAAQKTKSGGMYTKRTGTSKVSSTVKSSKTKSTRYSKRI